MTDYACAQLQRALVEQGLEGAPDVAAAPHALQDSSAADVDTF